MTLSTLVLAALAYAPPGGPAHDANPVLARLLRGVEANEGHAVRLIPPSIDDRADADAERAALKKIAGSERAVADLVRDSVTAPFVLKTVDEVFPGVGTVRHGDLWFVVRAGLDDIQPDKVAGAADHGEVEAANMKFSARRIDSTELSRRGTTPATGDDLREWYVHLTGRLLDRIHMEATEHVAATRTPRSWVIASQTDRSWDRDASFPNRWYPIVRKGGDEEPGASQVYPGGVSYVKITRLETVAGALLVESHFAFFEPKAWFEGAPILRSKIGVVAQDRIRSLRRELAKSQTR